MSFSHSFYQLLVLDATPCNALQFFSRDSHMEFSFDEALLYCLNQQDPESGYWNGHYYGLVSVGQLRHFRNRYDFGPSVDRHQHYFDEQRMFRFVNMQF